MSRNCSAPISAVKRPADFYASRVRHGKTKRDHENGNAKRSEAHRAGRASYTNTSTKTDRFERHWTAGLGNSSKPYKNGCSKLKHYSDRKSRSQGRPKGNR